MKKIALILWALICPQLAFAQGPVSICYTTNGQNCIKVSSTLGLPVNIVTGSVSVAFPTIGAAVPATGIYNALNVAGTLRGLTGVNPSGSVYAGQMDLASVGGTSISLGQTLMATSLPVAIASNQTALSVVGSAASGAALSGNPVRIGMSDGTNAQNWLAAIALADGVNGNNTGAVAPWVWNGTTYDRMPGTTAGVTVRNPTAANLNATIVGSGVAGTANTGVVTVQGIASMTKLLVTPDANSAINVAQINAITPLMGNGITGTGSQRVTIASDNTPFSTKIDQTTSAITNGVMNAAGHYETVAASQTAQAMGATGATGDYLSHCVVYPASTSPGVVTVFDNTNAAGTNVIAFPGGASSVSNLVPFAIPVGAISTAGAWKVTTGANVSAVCFGKFT